MKYVVHVEFSYRCRFSGHFSVFFDFNRYFTPDKVKQKLNQRKTNNKLIFKKKTNYKHIECPININIFKLSNKINY